MILPDTEEPLRVNADTVKMLMPKYDYSGRRAVLILVDEDSDPAEMQKLAESALLRYRSNFSKIDPVEDVNLVNIDCACPSAEWIK